MECGVVNCVYIYINISINDPVSNMYNITINYGLTGGFLDRVTHNSLKSLND